MKKKIFLRGLLGFPLGISIGYVIAIAGSLAWGNGNYSPCVPAMIDASGSEIGAVALQTALCGILGACSGAASVIWEVCDWSIAKQTGLYFLVLSAAMFPTAWFSYWMEHSLPGFLSYAAMFTAVFVLIWIVQYLALRRKINVINEKMKEKK